MTSRRIPSPTSSRFATPSRILTALSLAALSFGLAACSKPASVEAPAPLASSAPEEVVVTGCTQEQIRSSIAELSALRAQADNLNQVARISPAKTNFQRAFDAQAGLKRRAEATLLALDNCGSALRRTDRELVIVAIASSESITRYLADNFPELRPGSSD